MQAWEAGLAWAFIIGVIVLIGAFVGPYIRQFTPRAAMLGTLAGISITFISMRPAAQMWEAAWIGLPVLGDHHHRLLRQHRCPGGIPVGLAALLVGTAIGWIGGYMSAPDVGRVVHDIAHRRPRPLNLDMLFNGLRRPRAAAGDGDPARHLQLHRGDEQRGERGGRRRQLQPAQRAARRRRPAPSSAPRSARRSRRPSTSGTRAGRPPAAAPPTRWPAGSSSRCSASSGCSLCSSGAADAGDRADPAVHRPAHRGAGLPGGAEGARRGGRRRASCPTSPRGRRA